jgi:hypothetical protein
MYHFAKAGAVERDAVEVVETGQVCSIGLSPNACAARYLAIRNTPGSPY